MVQQPSSNHTRSGENVGSAFFRCSVEADPIARAFRDTCDEDVRLVLNAISDPSQQQVSELNFYVVAMDWLRKAWPFLLGQSSKRPDPIHNSALLHMDHPISSSSSSSEGEDDENDESGVASGRQQRVTKRWNERQMKLKVVNASKQDLRQTLVHEQDYVLLGPNAWTLLGEKLGFDVQLGRPLLLQQNPRQLFVVINESTVPNVLVPIPSTGRFSYDNVAVKPCGAQGAAIESDVEVKGWTGRGAKAGNSQDAANVPTDVVSDEDDEYDLFPGQDDSISGNPPSSEPILLLPPSTTAVTDDTDKDENGNQDGDPESKSSSSRLYPGVNDMEFETSSDVIEADVAPYKRKRHGAGLGNLGNTCFMNSTLQCLAHTHSLRRYFVSGEYEKDLNRNNPLGTGGELATQFADLLAEMWGISASSVAPMRRTLFPNNTAASNFGASVVYPRSFKYTLGKHAEQFMGYDQHDSQELATYLLDALHEDTNRVTKKPYVEKPEQGEDEPDDVAADKSWRLHLQREDSRVLENFMGQVKSRVQCPEEGCGRVSTTFDPFMYLSVPIPGATDRTMNVTFFPLDPQERKKNIKVTVPKSSTVGILLQKVSVLLHSHGVTSEPLLVDNLRAADVWSGEIYQRFRLDDVVDRIKDEDTTYIYEMRSVSEVRDGSSDELINEDLSLLDRTRGRSMLTLPVLARLNSDGEWKTTLENYVRSPTGLYNLFNDKKGRIEDLVRFHRKVEKFIDVCHASSEMDAASHKRSRKESLASTKKDSDSTESEDESTSSPNGNENSLPTLEERSESSSTFRNVRTKQDLYILEFCSNKVRIYTKNKILEKKKKCKDGVEIQIGIRKGVGNQFTFSDPLLLRIPPDMTVYALRKELAHRLSRSLRTGHPNGRPHSLKEESGVRRNGARAAPPNREFMSMEGDADNGDATVPITTSIQSGTLIPEDSTFGSPKLLILRQVPLSYSTAGSGHSHRSQIVPPKKLGGLDRQDYDGRQSLASPHNEEEKEIVADAVGQDGTVFLEWPDELCTNAFDSDEFEACVDISDENELRMAAQARKEARATSVLDCIDKYCQIEQLEETEMWYCNQCKKHVRAWKQFHLYRTPPILIVHLKRFHYSATSHRRDKIDMFIDFPLVGLDLTNHVMHWTEEEKPVYDCYAVSNHYGGLGGGHYTAYALSDDGEWCHFDDSRVTAGVDPKEVVSQAAYVLYYRRRDVDIGHDIMDVLPTPAIVHDHSEMANGDAHFGNVARIGDEDMDIEETASRESTRTSPSHMESTGGILDELDEFGVGDGAPDCDDEYDKCDFEDNGDENCGLPTQ